VQSCAWLSVLLDRLIIGFSIRRYAFAPLSRNLLGGVAAKQGTGRLDPDALTLQDLFTSAVHEWTAELDRQRARETTSQRGREPERQRAGEPERQRRRETETETEGETERQRDREAEVDEAGFFCLGGVEGSLCSLQKTKKTLCF